MKVEVRPLGLKKWHGKVGKESFTRDRKIQALVNEDLKYATGLSQEDINRLKEEGFKGELDNNFSPDTPHVFWDSKAATVVLKNSTQIYDTSSPMDFIKVSIMKANSRVANSMREFEDGMFPEATHVIFDEVEEVEARASKIALANKAVIEADKLSKDRKIQIILVATGKIIKSKSNDFIEVEIDKLIKRDVKEFLRLTNVKKEEIANKALILEAVERNIIVKKGHKYYYFDSVIGGSLEAVSDYLKKPDNQELKFNLIEKLEK